MKNGLALEKTGRELKQKFCKGLCVLTLQKALQNSFFSLFRDSSISSNVVFFFLFFFLSINLSSRDYNPNSL